MSTLDDLKNQFALVKDAAGALRDHMFAPTMGTRIVEDASLTVLSEDWSRVRSPARAKRRRKAGHPQRIRVVTVPNPDAFQMGDQIFMHPDTARLFRAATELADAE